MSILACAPDCNSSFTTTMWQLFLVAALLSNGGHSSVRHHVAASEGEGGEEGAGGGQHSEGGVHRQVEKSKM